MSWELDTERPVYLQLIELIQAGIVSGYYKLGDKLPSVRDLAMEAAVNPNTMQKALSELERIGLIYTHRTSGKYITSDKSMIESLQKQSAMKLINEFLDKMTQLGFHQNDTLDLIYKVVNDNNA